MRGALIPSSNPVALDIRLREHLHRFNVTLLADEELPSAKRPGLMLALSHPRLRQSDLVNQGLGLDRCHGIRNGL